MKNVIKNPIFTFILGALICGTTGVVASTLMAGNIAYTPKDSTWGVNNVEAAIDSLKLSKTSDNYSAEEKVIGTWIDGRPIYSKVLTLTINNNENYIFSGKDLISSDIDAIINASGYSVVDNGATISKFPCYYTNTAHSDVWMENTTKKVHIVTGSQYKTGTHYINFEYIKTKD